MYRVLFIDFAWWRAYTIIENWDTLVRYGAEFISYSLVTRIIEIGHDMQKYCKQFTTTFVGL